MFRCPECGQGKTIVLRDQNEIMLVVTMNDEMNEIESILQDDVEHKGETEYTDRIAGASPLQHVICVKEECGVSNELNQWTLAFQDPLMFFDMEELCHCGGELWMDKIPYTNKYGFICEDCEWVKPKKEISGS